MLHMPFGIIMEHSEIALNVMIEKYKAAKCKAAKYSESVVKIRSLNAGF